jgi:hypothetical protein
MDAEKASDVPWYETCSTCRTVPQTDAVNACAFYKDVVQRLDSAGIPFAIGGAYAFAHFTGIHRDTKDLDLMLKRADLERALETLESAGYTSEITFPHWLAKVYCGEDFVDLIFNSGNGVAPVDDEFFLYAPEDVMFDLPVRVCPIEEMIWTKAFVMERERYDGADIAHLLHVATGSIDWPRLLRRFGAHWRLLLNHLILIGYIYPHEQAGVPSAVMQELLERLCRENNVRRRGGPICGGTLVSREQFLVDVQSWGYTDGRLAAGVMSEAEIDAWTRAIEQRS